VEAAWAIASPLASDSCASNGVPGFDRIIHGWTNYSSAFNATHDLGTSGNDATVASFYKPLVDARPLEYSVMVIWGGASNQTPPFDHFTYEVHFWSSLEKFTNTPTRGDVGTFSFPAPTGGSMTVPDAITRRGWPAYELRFCLSNAPLTLTADHPYLVGLLAKTVTRDFDVLYVPTSNHPGDSDVQAGSVVLGGWTYLVDAGGSTIYWGQLATALSVQPLDLLWLQIELFAD